jgi:hypothetical protein
MNYKVIASIGAIFILIIGIWFYANVRAKANYDKIKVELSLAYTIKPINKEFHSFIDEVETKWSRDQSLEQSKAYNDVLISLGMQPTVESLVYVLNSPMPEYSWISNDANIKSALLGSAKSVMLTISTDGCLYLSDKKDVAVTLLEKSRVVIYKNAKDGIDIIYYKNEAK